MYTNRKVSILLPVYNREQYLKIAIDSVLTQTYQNWELLISDNCSTDGTFELAKKYAEQDARIICWRNETNIGPLPNYNKCIEKASGEYIELFGDDDIFEPECLAKLAMVLDDNPNVVMAIAGKRHIDKDGKLIREDRPRSGSQLICAQEVIESTVGTLTNWIISPVMYRAKYKGAGFDTFLGIYADLDYWAQILAYGDLFYVDEMLFNYRLHGGSESTRMYSSAEFMISLLRIAERYPQYLSVGNRSEIYKPVIEKLMAMVDYASNCLKVNYEMVLRPKMKKHMVEDKMAGKNGRVQELSEQESLIKVEEELAEEAHDYKRIAFLALSQAVEIKKKWIGYANNTGVHLFLLMRISKW